MGGVRGSSMLQNLSAAEATLRSSLKASSVSQVEPSRKMTECSRFALVLAGDPAGSAKDVTS
jgi:hypothetical protein